MKREAVEMVWRKRKCAFVGIVPFKVEHRNILSLVLKLEFKLEDWQDEI